MYQQRKYNHLLSEYNLIFKKSILDGHTELYNHSYFKEFLNKELARTIKLNLALSLIMLDIDYFKAYNDINGHQGGDLVLIRIAEILRKNTRDSDLVARYGVRSLPSSFLKQGWTTPTR